MNYQLFTWILSKLLPEPKRRIKKPIIGKKHATMKATRKVIKTKS